MLVSDALVACTDTPPGPPLRRGGEVGAFSSLASQSSRAGLEGALPMTPKSFSLVTSPSPKCPCHRRLTMTRATSGLAGDVIHRASDSRRSDVRAWGVGVSGSVRQRSRTAGYPGSTDPAGVRGL